MHTIQVHHSNNTHFEVLYYKHAIISIRRYNDSRPSGEAVEYDDLSLTEREAILLEIIKYLDNN